MLEKDLWKKLVAEFVGAFIVTASLVFPSIALHDAGIGAYLFIMFTAALGFGLVVWLFRDISNGYANPVITFVMMLMRKVSILTGILFWIAQLAGGVVATYYAIGMFKVSGLTATDLAGYSVAVPVTGYSTLQASLAEAFGAFVLVSVVLAMIQIKDKLQAGLAFAGTALVALVLTVAVSGAALNPAREFGAMLLTNGVYKNEYLYVYLLAPAIGAIVAVLIYLILNEKLTLSFNLARSKGDSKAEDDAK